MRIIVGQRSWFSDLWCQASGHRVVDLHVGAIAHVSNSSSQELLRVAAGAQLERVRAGPARPSTA